MQISEHQAVIVCEASFYDASDVYMGQATMINICEPSQVEDTLKGMNHGGELFGFGAQAYTRAQKRMALDSEKQCLDTGLRRAGLIE